MAPPAIDKIGCFSYGGTVFTRSAQLLIISLLTIGLTAPFIPTTFAGPSATFSSVARISIPSPTLLPTLLPTPIASPVAIQKSENPPSTNHFITAINEYRAQFGLAPVQENQETCAFAQIRAAEIKNDFTHNGFRSRIDNHTLPYASYTLVTENIAKTQDPSRVVAMWIDSPTHAENMRKPTSFVCVVQNGEYFAYEGWQS